MGARAIFASCAALFLLASCGEQESGPIIASAIGGAPERLNPNLRSLDTPSALLLENAAQGLVRFDAAGQLEPGLAQSWIVSDDGLRYTFRLARVTWEDGSRVTAEQVVQRLRAASSRASRNPLKNLLGAIDEIVAMTDDVLEISLKAPRPAILQLLAQPEMAVLRANQGTGPYRADMQGGLVLLRQPDGLDEEEQDNALHPVQLRGEKAGVAIARFAAQDSDFVTGGTMGDLPLLRVARVATGTQRFDPANGLFGLAFERLEGPWSSPAARQALSMAIDRGSLATRLQVPEFRPRATLVPDGIDELPQPASPAWAGAPIEQRRTFARQSLAGLDSGARLRVRVAVPQGPGYRLILAHLSRDWRAIGVETIAVAPDAPADLRLIDAIAPATLATWYLRRFSCEISPVCDGAVDTILADARATPNIAERSTLLANADRQLTDAAFYLPLGSPIRWSLVSQRLNGFRPNAFARHPLSELIDR
ncbi:ABC transporter substrate-binding protein [Allosphingosinicella vermicomposti]|uniref:ABC transporter substrate-binding protein n=1 Tax=Allosphingosinicella vermicomposti TaxID=614671 RepID=UPI000D10DE49|nr:ABC transporter substrate-binding protein [Allosphingosinicella vermicomposti]